MVESSIEEPVMRDTTLQHQNRDQVTFQLVEEGSKCRKTKLVDSLSYSYNVWSKRAYATYWQCRVCPRGNACKATVIQRDGNFHSGEKAHNHPAEAGAMTTARIVKLVKEKANSGQIQDRFSNSGGGICKLHLKNSQELAYVVRILLNFRIVS